MQCVQIADRTCPEVLVIVKIVILVMHIQQNVNIINTDDGKFNKTKKCRTPLIFDKKDTRHNTHSSSCFIDFTKLYIGCTLSFHC